MSNLEIVILSMYLILNHYQHARNFDWGMTSAVGIENRRWTVKLQYEISLGKESKNDNIGVNYNSLTLSVGYKLNVK